MHLRLTCHHHCGLYGCNGIDISDHGHLFFLLRFLVLRAVILLFDNLELLLLLGLLVLVTVNWLELGLEELLFGCHLLLYYFQVSSVEVDQRIGFLVIQCELWSGKHVDY